MDSNKFITIIFTLTSTELLSSLVESGCSVNICEWSRWSTWPDCSHECAGGTRTRDRSLCCDTSHSLRDCIVKDCGWDYNVRIHDFDETENCNTFCYNGGTYVFSGYCRCPDRYRGTCCGEVVTCGRPNSISNGSFSGRDFTYAGRVTYSCDRNYNMTDPSEASRTCTKYGSWSGSPPTCLYAESCSSCPCWNGALCHNLLGDYKCSCNAGWSGKNCEVDIDECISRPCLNNGSCIDDVNGYSCVCSPGFTGSYCEIDIDECQSYPCLHNGTCFDLINSFFCGCENGYSGNRCEIDVDDCMDKPCLNDGNCTDLLTSFSCSCPPAFTGAICQTGIDPCSSEPCKNNGKCLSHNSTYFTCSCMDGWGGMNCAYRHQNESFVNSSFMTGLHMHYSECDCFLGNIKKQLCYKHKKGNSIGYGAVGMFLGILTIVGLYDFSEVFLKKECPPNVEKMEAEEQIKHKDDHRTEGYLGKFDGDAQEQEKTKPKKVKPHIHGHKHRKCWACEIKYNNATPPRYW